MTHKNLLLLICFFALSCTQTDAQKSIEGFEAPESVIKQGNKIFVSNIGGAQANPMALDSNGFISELSADGKILQQKFQKTVLNGPKGLAIIKNVLYVADINRVVGFDINSGEQVFELTLAGVSFLNDLCKAADNMLAVSESMQNKIYLINTDSKTYKVEGTVAGANGVTYNEKTKQLFACGMGEQMNGTGKLYVKNINSKDTGFTELPNSPTGIFDGIEMTDESHLIVSDWISFNSEKGRLVVYDLKNHSVISYRVESGPADITYDKSSRKVYIPQMPKNRLLIVDPGSLEKE